MPVPTGYALPKTRSEALALLAQPDKRAMLYAPRPTNPAEIHAQTLVDLRSLGLDAIAKAPDGSLHLGGLICLQALVEDPLLQHGEYRLLAECASITANPALRNMVSLWGCLQAAEGPKEVLLALLALDARVVILDQDEIQLTLPVAEILEREKEAIPFGSILLEVILPPASGCGWALERVARTPRDEAIVSAAVVVKVENSKCKLARLALGGSSPSPRRFTEVEIPLTGLSLEPSRLKKVEEQVSALADPVSDFRGSAEYRRAMAGLTARRALEIAWQRAVEGEA